MTNLVWIAEPCANCVYSLLQPADVFLWLCLVVFGFHHLYFHKHYFIEPISVVCLIAEHICKSVYDLRIVYNPALTTYLKEIINSFLKEIESHRKFCFKFLQAL